MRILFDSKNPVHKTPFGTLTPGQECTMNIHIPADLQTSHAEIVIEHEDGRLLRTIPMTCAQRKGAYDIFRGSFSFPDTGLFFYYFRIVAHTGPFQLFKQGEDTNMEAGDKWQLSCVPADFTTPDWAKGAVIYQLFPDRFHRTGRCDLTGKLEPYVVHRHWNEEVFWQPTPSGEVLNNDFYGGNFRGITEKMGYIASLGVSILYLNPISMSFSSHRYDTGDYKRPDPMLGTEADFAAMCKAAHAHGIRVILDGVYSHTGSDSLYFDKKRSFGGKGAYCSKNSPYSSWYTFYRWPDSYHCWWNFDTLPTVNKMDPEFVKFIITDEDSVVAHWRKLGADGYRLDVAYERPDEFIKLLRNRIRELKPDALLLGEVWDDASNKLAYNRRRTYFTNAELDSVMNYPFRTAILNFMRERDAGRGLKEAVMTVVENYPPQVVACNMNLLGTHDTPRILTALVDDFEGTRQEQARRHLSPQKRQEALERLLMASFLQYTLPGSPSLYYGDEAGMEGSKDPFNRRTYPWGHENGELIAHFRRLGQLRKSCPVLRTGNIEFFQAADSRIGFTRTLGDSRVRIYVNRSDEPWDVPAGKTLLGHSLRTVAPKWTTIAPMGYLIVEE